MVRKENKELNQAIKTNPKVCVVIPTYNEAENIEKLVRQILDLKIPNLNIIVVDDNSPDGTGTIAERLKRKTKNEKLKSNKNLKSESRSPRSESQIDVIHRKEKLGLGTAYVAGFKQALKEGADYIITMDADLSHKPHYIVDLLGQSNGFDLVIGSRYVKGGSIKGWQWDRILLSKAGNLTAKLLLRIPVKDITSGFRCYKRKVIENVGIKKVESTGYSYLMEMLYFCRKEGYKISESPIHFGRRHNGKSKISTQEAKYTVKLLFQLLLRK